MISKIRHISLVLGVSALVAGCGTSAHHPTHHPKPHHPTALRPPASSPPVHWVAGSPAWVRAARAAFVQDSGLTSTLPFWFIRDTLPAGPKPDVAYRWLALDPVVQNGKLWAGAETATGQWCWWGVSIQTGAHPSSAGSPHPSPMPRALYVPAATAVAWSHNAPPPPGWSAIPRLVWQADTGHYLAPAGWQFEPLDPVSETFGIEVWLTGDNKPGWGGYFGLQTWWNTATANSSAAWLTTVPQPPHAASVDGIAAVSVPASQTAGILSPTRGANGGAL